MYFLYFHIFSTKVPLKFEKCMKLLYIFGDKISKRPDIIRKNTPLPAYSLDSSRSIKLKLLVKHYETPCSLVIMSFVLSGLPTSQILVFSFTQSWTIFGKSPAVCQKCSPLKFAIFSLEIRCFLKEIPA